MLLLILLAAGFFRIWKLDAVPPGLTHDEANNVHDATAILDGVRPIYFPVAQGKEPLYLYSVAALMAALGRAPWVMRLASAAWGWLLVALVYGWTRRAFGREVALLTAAGLAVAFWPVSTARMGLRAITLPAVFTAFTYCVWRGMEGWKQEQAPRNPGGFPRRRAAWLVAAGVTLGLTAYTYLAARSILLTPVVFIAYLFLFHRRLFRGRWLWVMLVFAIATLIASPLVLYLRAHPSAEIRIGQLDRPLQELMAGDPGPLLQRASEGIQLLSIRGDTFVPYNLPGKPLFGPVMSLMFYLGLAIALFRWRRPAYAWVLAWFLAGFAPVLVTGAEAANLRAIACQPPAYLFAGLAMVEMAPVLQRVARPGRLGRAPSAGMVLFLVGALFFVPAAVLTYRDYFVRWAGNRDVRVHYHVDLVAIAGQLDSLEDQPIAISALYPGEYHDPVVVEAVMGHSETRLRWFDGQGAVVIPEREWSLVVPSIAPVDSHLLQWMGPLQLVERVVIDPSDLSPAIDIYRVRSADSGEFATSNGSPRLGGQLMALHAQVEPSQPLPGSIVRLTSFWLIAGQMPAERDAVIFAQVLGPDGSVLTQEDRLDVPSWNWHVGDRFIQLFRLPLPAGLEPGSYRLIMGAYSVADRVDSVLSGVEPDAAMPRLPVSRNGVAAGDFVEMPPIQVRAGG